MKKTLKLTDRSLNKILIREAVLTKAAQSCIITSTPARAVCCGQPHTTHSTALHMCTRITSPTTWVKAVMKGRMSCASLTFQIANTYGLKESFQRQKKTHKHVPLNWKPQSLMLSLWQRKHQYLFIHKVVCFSMLHILNIFLPLPPPYSKTKCLRFCCFPVQLMVAAYSAIYWTVCILYIIIQWLFFFSSVHVNISITLNKY